MHPVVSAPTMVATVATAGVPVHAPLAGASSTLANAGDTSLTASLPGAAGSAASATTTAAVAFNIIFHVVATALALTAWVCSS